MKRPFGVTIIGALLLLQGLVLVVSVAVGVWLRITHQGDGQQTTIVIAFGGFMLYEWPAVVVGGALGVFSVAAGIGVLRLHPWAWFVAMVLQGWTLATLLVDYFIRGGGSYLNMLLAATIVFYLNTRSVRETFDLARSRVYAGDAGDAGDAGVRPAALAHSDAPDHAAQGTAQVTPVRQEDPAGGVGNA
jgi:hypothetical protein